MSSSRLMTLAKAFADAELRDCARESAERFYSWIEPFAVPADSITAPTDGTNVMKSIERDGVFVLAFFDWWIEGETVIGRPRVPNDAEEDVPRDPNVGYRIPVESLRKAPTVRHKIGYRDDDGFVVLNY